MYDCAEELGEIELFGMERLSLSLSFTLSGPAIRVQDEMLKCCICVFGSQRNRSAFLFFVLVYCSISLFSLILSFFFKKEEETGQRRKKGKKKLCMRRNRQVLKKNPGFRVVRGGRGYQFKVKFGNNATTISNKNYIRRQTTSEQKRNLNGSPNNRPKLFYSIPSRVSSKAGFNSPLLYCKNCLSLFPSSISCLFLFLTHWQWGAWHLQSAFKEKMCQGSVIPPPPSLSLSLSLAHWQGGTSQAHYSQRIYGAEPNAGEKASVNNCREQRTHISRSFEISLGMQLSGIKIKTLLNTDRILPRNIN